MFLLSTIQSNNKLKFLLIWKNAMETAKIAVDSCYVLRQFLTPLPSIDFREIRGLVSTMKFQSSFLKLLLNIYGVPLIYSFGFKLSSLQ
jgi:hypothetical protein